MSVNRTVARSPFSGLLFSPVAPRSGLVCFFFAQKDDDVDRVKGLLSHLLYSSRHHR